MIDRGQLVNNVLIAYSNKSSSGFHGGMHHEGIARTAGERSKGTNLVSKKL